MYQGLGVSYETQSSPKKPILVGAYVQLTDSLDVGIIMRS